MPGDEVYAKGDRVEVQFGDEWHRAEFCTYHRVRPVAKVIYLESRTGAWVAIHRIRRSTAVRRLHAANNLPRGECPMCGRDVALRRGGEYREHRKPEGGICEASGLTAAAAVAKRYA